VKGWQGRFLRRSAVRKAPRATGSRRRLSPQRLEDHAALLVVQAVAARRAYRPIGWLALVLYDMDVNRPPGARKISARSNIALIAAALATSADWRSGRRGRPGRQVSAALAGLSERTVERIWKLLESRELARRETDGELLNADQRGEATADEDVSPDQRDRWTNRADFTLQIPDWARELTDEQIWPYIERAAAMLDELAAPARGAAPVDIAGDGAVDNRPGHTAVRESVAPSIDFEVLTSLPVRRGSFSLPPTVDKPVAAPPPVPVEKGHTGGASHHSSTNRGSRRSRGGMAPGVVRLAREMAADSRFPFIQGVRDILPIAGVLHRRNLGRWTVDDVAAEAELRLAESHKAMLTSAAAPASYVDWLLKVAVPSDPPAQIAAALAESARAERIAMANQRAREWHDRELQRVDPAASAGGRAARALVDQLAERRHQAKLAEARRRDARDERLSDRE
jgi:hypothetical protein